MIPTQASPSVRLGSSLAKERPKAMLHLAGSISRGARNQQQVRTLRLGIWSSYLHSNLEKELHRHHRLWKHKYEALSRKAPWDPHNLRSARRPGFKGFMYSAWRAKDSWSPASWVDSQEPKRKASYKENYRGEERGIEDVEQSALDKLLRSRTGMYEFIRDRSGMLSRGWSRTISPSEHTTDSSTGVSSNPSSEIHSAYGTEGFRRRFQSQRNQSMDSEYEIDPITNRKVFKNKPTEATEPSGVPIDIPVKTFKGHRPHFQDFAPPGKTPIEGLDAHTSSAKEPSIRFDTSCQSAIRNDPSRLLKSTEGDQVQEGLRSYDNKTLYEAFRFNEPDGKPQSETVANQDGLEEYDSLTSYGAFRYLEPDGKLETDEPLDSVQRGLDNSDKEKPSDASLHNNEGLPRPSQCYSASMDTTEDLDLLRSSDVWASSGILRHRVKESEKENFGKRRALEDDFQQAQARETAYAEELAAVRKKKEMQKAARDLRIENSELQNHIAHARGKVNAKIAELEAEMSTTLSGSIASGRPHSQSEFERNVQRAENEYVASLLEKVTPIRMETALDRTLSADSGSSTVRLTSADLEKDPYSKEPQGLKTSYTDELIQANSMKTPELGKVVPLEAERDPYSKEPMGLETNYAEECVKMGEHEAEKDPYSKEPMGLETHYVEECAQMSQHEAERDPYSKEPMGLETSYAEECAQQGDRSKKVVFSCYESSGSGGSERGTQGNLTTEEKRKSNRIMRQRDKELVREVRNIYEQSYGTIDSKHRQPPEPVKLSPQAEDRSSSSTPFRSQPPSEEQQPTLYKILAYDATMQSISEASTTSIVNDSASALTPAEALLRLSNPAKFFPFFEPLQREGYEIVSGSGDVLVFRKVRAAEPTPESSHDHSRKIINPIDGMETIPATGNFASPTGFVNHDLFPNSEPPFKSNIDVRREEPVFSGKLNWQDGSNERGRQKRGRAKRLLIGAAWVGVCSYAIGVVAEFFRTGGLDGKGPQGF